MKQRILKWIKRLLLLLAIFLLLLGSFFTSFWANLYLTLSKYVAIQVAHKNNTPITLVHDIEEIPSGVIWLGRYITPSYIPLFEVNTPDSNLAPFIDNRLDTVLQNSFLKALSQSQFNSYQLDATAVNTATQFNQNYLSQNQAQVIVVLGGGLSRDAQHHVLPNMYTTSRLKTAVLTQQKLNLPIFVSGVEAPWMKVWLEDKHIKTIWQEKHSMNTCENARFSALLLQHMTDSNTVYLITDAYHMPRARRLFAQNGFETIPIVAPLPGGNSTWTPARYNLIHTKRAFYEFLAMARDLTIGSTNCREIP